MFKFNHYVKSVQIWFFFKSAFSHIPIAYVDLFHKISKFSSNTGKCGPEKTKGLVKKLDDLSN